MLIHSPIRVPTDDSSAELDRLGDEIAELAAHLDAATARLLDLIRWKGLSRDLYGIGVPKSPCVHNPLWKEESR